MSKNIHCPMIHGGLNIDLKGQFGNLSYNQCCLSTTQQLTIPSDPALLWNDTPMQNIRQLNNSGVWLEGCWQCQHVESAGLKSFRQSMIEGLGVEKDLPGPQRIDFLFDRSCNLACRTCSPSSSTLWEKHLRENNLPVEIFNATDNFNTIKKLLENLDLSNLKQVQFCGGETLLGNTYWKMAQLLADLIPNAKDNVLLGFQTNATQPIDKKYYSLIEKFKLVKLMLSIDGTHNRFEYLRWPANWNQVVDNIFNLREKLPGNVMYYVQECTSNLNLFYFGEVENWIRNNFNTNREGDRVDYSTQLAMHSYLNVNIITQEYIDAIKHTNKLQFISPSWQEDPVKIKEFIKTTEMFDQIRGENWKKTFPEVADFYSRYL